MTSTNRPRAHPSPAAREGGERRLVIGLIATNAVVAAMLALLVVVVLMASRRSYEVQSRTTAEGLVAIAQANVGSELSRVDAVLRAAMLEIAAMREEGTPSDAAINHALEAHRQLLPGVEGLRMADADGLVRWGNALPAGAAVNISDRDYFPQVREQAASGNAVIAGPVQSRVSGRWVMVLLRPLSAAGRFNGVLYATVATQNFQKLLDRYSVGEQDAITVRTADLQLVARRAPGSSATAEVGSKTVSAELLASLARSPQRGVYASRAVIDGIERTTAYQRVDDWPFVVFAGLSNERLFAPWRTQVWQVSLLALIAWLIVTAATYAAYRAWHRASEGTRALSAQTRQVEALLRVAGDGIHIVDTHGRLVAMSDSFAQMLGATPDQLLGRHVSSWDVHQDEARISAWLANVQEGSRQLVEVQHRRDDGRIIDVELQLSVANIEGELLVFASARDITERKRLQASLAESAAQIRDLYDQAPCGYHSLNEDGVFVHVNATMLKWLGRSADEVLDRARLSDFLDDESSATFAANFPRLKKVGHLEGVEVRLVPPGQPERQLRASVVAVYGADGRYVMSRSVTQDVTVQHQAESEARRLMHEQAAMLDNDIVGMVKLRDRVAIWKNRALERMFGYAPGELDGQPARLLYPDDASYQALGDAAYPLLATGAHYETQLPMRHKDGHLLWISLSGVMLSDDVSFWMMVDITAMKETQARIEHMAFHDALTQLPNRLLLADRVAHAIQSAARSSATVAVCYLDLDGFKQVNDTHGHDAGDALLAEIGRRLRTSLRGNDTAARVGGDEFVILLTMLSQQIDWRRILERVMAELQTPMVLAGGLTVQIGTSVGVALAPQDGTDPAQLLAKADRAMLRAKRAGKSRIELVSPGDCDGPPPAG